MALQERFPWTKRPLIINAPMGGIALADLAIAVTRAGGLGQVGAVDDLDVLTAQLTKVEEAVGRHDGLLPIGVGLLSFILMKKRSAAIDLIGKFQPAVLWLFAANSIDDYTGWANEIRKASPRSQVWIQVGSVEGALKIAAGAKPDVICVQGLDAGGHGFEQGAGVISLVPEVADRLAAAGHDIPLVAAGGIVDGRAAAAALALGAQGVVMGTRFLAAEETNVHPQYRSAILAAHDGGQQTVRAKLFDELQGPNQWPMAYDGRSIRNDSFRDWTEGVEIEEIRRRHADTVKSKSAGYAPDAPRAAIWAGTGVGLVREQQRAAEILEEVRQGVLAAMATASARL